MITYIPAREWYSSNERKPKDGVEVLGVIGKGKSAYLDIVTYDSRDHDWILASGGLHFTKVRVPYWTELPNLPHPDRSRTMKKVVV